MRGDPVCRFAEMLRVLLASANPEDFDRVWEHLHLERLGWQAITSAWRADRRRWALALEEVDALLYRLLARLSHWGPADRSWGGAPGRVRVFRRAELQRLQHATAAALVAQRFGLAGLRTVVDDAQAPMARRYFAFVAAAERHPPRGWSLFEAYLHPQAHHAFQGAAAEAARFYPNRDAPARLISLFEAIRSDEHRRAFLGPRILTSLFVLDDPAALPFLRGLLVGGHAHPDPERCEILYALVMIRRWTGRIDSSVKFGTAAGPDVVRRLDDAERRYRGSRRDLHPVLLI